MSRLLRTPESELKGLSPKQVCNTSGKIMLAAVCSKSALSASLALSPSNYSTGHKDLRTPVKLGQKLEKSTTHTSILIIRTHVFLLLRFLESPFPPDNVEILELSMD